MIILYLKKKQIRLTALIAIIGFLLVLGCFTLPSAVRQVAAAGEKPVYAVEREDKTIALSFDASWGAEHTEEILATLKENEVKTTFFLVNLWIDSYPELVKKIDAEGHEIGLHSATHPHFTSLSAEDMRRELNANSEALAKLITKQPTLFRAPYGDYNDEVLATANDLGLTTVQWSVDSLDWKGLSSEEICSRVLDQIKGGDIVLLHNNGEHTAEALKTILPTLTQNGYHIVPIGKLLVQGDYYIDANGIMHGEE